jgi:hypothetical protein
MQLGSILHDMNKPPARAEQSISIRFPPDVLEALRELAQASGRSFNGEVVWALRKYVERSRGGSMDTYDRFKTIQVPGTAIGDDPVVCLTCGKSLPMSQAYQVKIDRADIPSGGLVSVSNFYACRPEHAQAVVGAAQEEPARRAPRIPTRGAPNAR